jgi:hypothetical protein
MSYSALRSAIEARFKSNWTYTPVQWPNKSFDPNNQNDVGSFNVGGKWVRFTVNTGTSQQVSIESTPLKRITGIIVVQIFLPIDAGLGDADTLADHVRTIFEDQSFSGVICRATSKVNVGPSKEWFQVNANTLFNYDYT